MDLEKISLNIILHGGNARAKAFEALEACKKGDYERADRFLRIAKEEITKAHVAQTKVLNAEAKGKNVRLNLLFIHSLDILMIATSEIDLVECIIELHKTPQGIQ